MAAKGTAKVKAIPDGYRSVTPYLIVKGAAKAIDFYKKVFGAREKFRMDGPGGAIAHAEIEIGDSVVMLADENPQHGALSPASVGGTPVSIMLYVEDVDRVAEKLTQAGQDAASGAGHVLRRPERRLRGPIRPSLARFHPHRGRDARGDRAAHGEDEGLSRAPVHRQTG